MFCLSYNNWSQCFLITLPEETFTAKLLPWEIIVQSIFENKEIPALPLLKMC